MTHGVDRVPSTVHHPPRRLGRAACRERSFGGPELCGAAEPVATHPCWSTSLVLASGLSPTHTDDTKADGMT